MKNRKATKATKTLPAPPTLPTTAAQVETRPTVAQLHEQRWRRYSPELSTWEVFKQANPMDCRTFDVCEVDAESGRVGVLIAKISASGEFGSVDAERAARLMAFAPALYRALRQVAPHALNDLDGLRDYNAAVEAMFQAIGHYPYAAPTAEYGEKGPD